MPNFEVTGKILKKLDLRSGTSARGEWVSQDFVLEYQDGNFPSTICFSAWGKDKVADLDNLNEGDAITVSFNIRGREYNGKWYNDLRVWKINRSAESNAQQSQPQQLQAPQPQASAPSIEDMQADIISNDDLPF